MQKKAAKKTGVVYINDQNLGYMRGPKNITFFENIGFWCSKEFQN